MPRSRLSRVFAYSPAARVGLCPCVHFSGAGVGLSGAPKEGWRPQLHPQVIHGLAPWVMVTAMAGCVPAAQHGMVMAIILFSVAALAVSSWRAKRLQRKGKGLVFMGKQVR